MMLAWLSPGNARSPVAISYSTAPNAKMSVRASTARPSSCSGAMYCKRADEDALRRDRRVARRPGLAGEHALDRRPCEAEVEKLRAGARQHDVGRLEVAVDDAVAVRAIERVGDLGAVADHLVGGQRPARQPAGQRLALQVLHDEEGDAFLLADVVEHADVRMVHRPDRPRFAVEPLAQLRVVGEDRREDLDGDGAVEPGVAGLVDLPHPAGPDRGDYLGTGPAGPLARATSRTAILTGGPGRLSRWRGRCVSTNPC